MSMRRAWYVKKSNVSSLKGLGPPQVKDQMIGEK
jgi:hypothetical protein